MSGEKVGLIAGIVVWLLFRSQISSAIGHEGGFSVVLMLLAALFGVGGGGLGSVVESAFKGRSSKDKIQMIKIQIDSKGANIRSCGNWCVD